jgi:hypothetical protein
MPKKPISLTLDHANLLWLQGRARLMTGGSISEAIDQIVAEARLGRLGAAHPSRSVAGTIDLGDEPDLRGADEVVRRLFSGSLQRPLTIPAAKTRGARARRKKSIA